MGSQRAAHGAPESTRSLDQLKSLNTIKGIEEQLNVAHNLCNHAHRSDMILRWLIPKLNESAYRSSVLSWQLFTRCVRLLHPALLAARLKNSQLLHIITQAVLEDSGQSRDELVAVLASLLQILVSIDPQLVATTSDVAAEFFAAWLRSTWTISTHDNIASLLTPALRVWELRRTPGDEDFTNKCLLPAALSLATFKPHDQPKSTKRGRDGLARMHNSSQVLQLEQLIATHVFMRSRAVFLRSKEQGSPETALELLHTQIKSLEVQLAANMDHDYVDDIYPTLLNIAIRCGSISRQRQMLPEMAWYDAVFAALSAQLTSLFEPSQVKDTITTMLDVVKHRSSLSLQMLQTVVQQHAALESDHPALDMIKTVISMNARSFTDEEHFVRLASVLERSQQSIAPNDTKEHIIIPLLGVFAQDRRLLDFIDLWQDRAEKAAYSDDLVWFWLDDILENKLEEHLTVQQVTAALKSRFDDLGTATGSSADSRTLTAVCVVTSALLRGINSAEIEEAILSDANAAFDKLLTAVKKSKLDSIPNLWSCALQLLNLCAPRWITQPDNSPHHSSTDILKSSLGKYALKQSKSEAGRAASRQAIRFLGRLGVMYKDDKDTAKTIGHALNEYANAATEDILDVLIEYPSLVSLLDEGNVVRICGSHSSKTRTASYRSINSKAIYEALHSRSPALARKTFNKLHENGDLVDTAMITQLPLVEAKYLKSADLVDALLTSLKEQEENIAPKSAGIIQKLLYLEQIAGKASLSLDEIGVLCDSMHKFDLNTSSFPQALSLMTINLRKIVKLHTSSPEIQPASKALSHFLRNAVVRLDNSPVATTVATLSSISTVLQATTDNGVSILQQKSLQAEVRKAWSTTMALLETTQQKTGTAKDDKQDSMVLSAALQAIGVMFATSATLQLDAGDLARSQQLAALIMTATTPEAATAPTIHALPTLTHPAVRAYELMCRNTNPDVVLLAHAACRLMDAPFSHAEKHLIEQAYSRLAGASPTSSRLLAVQSLLSKDKEDITASDIAILQTTLNNQERTTLQPEELASLTSAILQLTHLTRHTRSIVSQAALRCLSHALQHKSYLFNQYAVEESLNTIQHLAKPSKAEVLIFPELCSVMAALLKHHRGRLNSRFHVLIPTLQALLRRLLAPVPRVSGAVFQLSHRHAHSYARLLILLCEPPQQKRRQIEEADRLVDQARRTRAHAGSFVAGILHSYCSLVLRTPPRQEIRDALTPGLWSLMGAMELNDTDCMKILSSAMSDSERSVLRSIVDEWRLSTRSMGR